MKTRKKMVPVRIEGAPSSDSLVEESSAAVCGTAVLKQSTPLIASDNILVTIQTRDGLNIRKSNLDYLGLKELVEKLEGLC
ncbi:hypothetical protein M107_0774 [Bacteroides fragilis str. 3725 D9(v)]|uniref:hypothetical protein n=1 Tax=Bacteroides fragilis TaxID=817 RepID=UPI00044DA393|nr:hypothetical protein [Bacteroides fragilis]EXZ64983.1 hypothetical protein M107_0774 [Bacteroides fragilis str. 3725 D9(v)]MCZ2628860.1 hypothetical protein [Bacteroides fragilis]UVQ03966.1 hypothetical protein NXW51_07775 [Bacteroides fragilis]